MMHRREGSSPPQSRYVFADSSPYVGHDWLIMRTRGVPLDRLHAVASAMDELCSRRVAADEEPMLFEPELQPLRPGADLYEQMAAPLSEHTLPPTAMGL
eukprot:1334601-Alexandrium_andersonii.AAC.1